MKINIFPIVSSLHEKNQINAETQKLLAELKEKLNATINICDVKDLYNGDLALILIQSGGSEAAFLENLPNLKAPYYLLTYGTNNSLAASLEILSYLKDQNAEAEVLHGSINYLTKRIKAITTKLKPCRLGVLGKPSDWLIASNVNYADAKKYHNVELVDIAMAEVLESYQKAKPAEVLPNLEFDKDALAKSKQLLSALENIKAKYQLDGLTIRCFDLLTTIHTTACLSLAYFNAKDSVSTCEGDIPTMLSMHIVNELFHTPGFQANPSRIDVEKQEMVFAHCTLPLNMTTSYKLDTHFESGIGVAIRGKLKEEKITIFKLAKDLKHYYVTTGKIVKNLEEANLCRTQIVIKVDDNIEYFLTRPYGNHHVIIYGDHKQEIIDFMNNLLN